MGVKDDFPIGTRVVITCNWRNKEGVVVGHLTPHYGPFIYVKVLRDGLKTVQTYNPVLLRKVRLKMNFAVIFNKAADLLESGGLTAGARQVGTAHCAIGALESVLSGGMEVSTYPAASMPYCEKLVELLDLKPACDRHNFYYDDPVLRTNSPQFIVAAWSNNLVEAGKSEEVIKGFRTAASLAQNEVMA